MLPGPDKIVACPSCKGLAKYGTVMSGNTFGMRVWTDGKNIAPMLPSPPAVVKCFRCGELYWLSEADEIGTFDRWSEYDPQLDPEWAAADPVQEPMEEDYYPAIARGLAKTPQQEKFLRILAWWRSNDIFRDRPEAPVGHTLHRSVCRELSTTEIARSVSTCYEAGPAR